MEGESDIYGLVYNCPVLDRAVDCPFAEIDHLTFKQKVEWIETLDPESKRMMVEHHRTCSAVHNQPSNQNHPIKQLRNCRPNQSISDD